MGVCEETIRRSPSEAAALRAGQIDMSSIALDKERSATAALLEVQVEERIIVPVENWKPHHECLTRQDQGSTTSFAP